MAAGSGGGGGWGLRQSRVIDDITVTPPLKSQFSSQTGLFRSLNVTLLVPPRPVIRNDIVEFKAKASTVCAI